MTKPPAMTATCRRIECLSPAKLNLFLHITGRQANGYHTLQTVFQLLDWGDDMVFEPVDTPGVRLVNPVVGVAHEDNLIIRAANALAAPEQGVNISINKRIPQGGGLGGGSSNAASTLLALNHLWDLNYSRDELADIGASLGADVPIFVRGQSAWAEGIGDIITPMNLPKRWFVILRPNCHVSTAKIFSTVQLTRDSSPITMSAFFSGSIRNDLQVAVEAAYPEVGKALNLLNKFSPAMMTGSGGCVFAAVDDETSARHIAAATEGQFDTFVACGVNASPPVITHQY